MNSFDAQHNGLEITSKYHWGNHNQLTFNYTYQTLSSNYVPYDTNGSYSDSMPGNMISALYSGNFARNIDLSLGYYQQGTMLPIDRSATDREPFARRVVVKIARKFMLNDQGNEGDIALVVQAPLTSHYIDYRVRNQFTRRVFLTTTFSF